VVVQVLDSEMTGETGLSQGSSTDEQRVAWWEDVGIPELDTISGMLQQVANLCLAGRWLDSSPLPVEW
jgi:hypothetical protein